MSICYRCGSDGAGEQIVKLSQVKTWLRETTDKSALQEYSDAMKMPDDIDVRFISCARCGFSNIREALNILISKQKMTTTQPHSDQSAPIGE